MSDSQGIPIEQEPKYTVRDGRVVNRASGEAIPEDEPFFVFRARDLYAVAALDHYADIVGQGEHRDAVIARIKDFEIFAGTHPERMKEPDTDKA